MGNCCQTVIMDQVTQEPLPQKVYVLHCHFQKMRKKSPKPFFQRRKPKFETDIFFHSQDESSSQDEKNKAFKISSMTITKQTVKSKNQLKLSLSTSLNTKTFMLDDDEHSIKQCKSGYLKQMQKSD